MKLKQGRTSRQTKQKARRSFDGAIALTNLLRAFCFGNAAGESVYESLGLLVF